MGWRAHRFLDVQLMATLGVGNNLYHFSAGLIFVTVVISYFVSYRYCNYYYYYIEII